MGTIASARMPTGSESGRYWTRDEYYRAGELGIFEPEERLELLEGEIYRKMPEKPIHSSLMDEINATLIGAFAGQDVYSRLQHPIHLPNDSEPEPDIVIVRGKPHDYRLNHPVPDDILLLVEIANTSTDLDYGRKRHIYAAAGIREYWIVNIQDSVLDVFRNPEQGFMVPFARCSATDTITALAFPNVIIAVANLLPVF